MISGIWSEQNRSQESIQKKLDSPPPAPVWSPKSAPPSPTAERKFRPVPFESPTLPRRKLSTKDCPSPPPWTDPDYKDKPYQGSIIKSSSLNTISSSRIQQPNHIIFKKAKGNKKKEIDIYRIHPICALEKFIHLIFFFLSHFHPQWLKRHLSQLIFFTHLMFLLFFLLFYFLRYSYYMHVYVHIADQFNEKVDKGTQNTSPKDKLISFKTTPLKSSKSNELGKKIKWYMIMATTTLIRTHAWWWWCDCLQIILFYSLFY